MKRNLKILLAVLMVQILCLGHVLADEDIPPEIIELGNDPVILAAVKAENAKQKTMDQIKETNAKWMMAEENDPFFDQYLKSDSANHLRKLLDNNPALAEVEEVYVMDNQATVVASVKREEHYWWGEREGVQDAMKGTVHVSDLEMDEDEMELMIHILLPLRDGNTVIGVMDIGLEAGD